MARIKLCSLASASVYLHQRQYWYISLSIIVPLLILFVLPYLGPLSAFLRTLRIQPFPVFDLWRSTLPDLVKSESSNRIIYGFKAGWIRPPKAPSWVCSGLGLISSSANSKLDGSPRPKDTVANIQYTYYFRTAASS